MNKKLFVSLLVLFAIAVSTSAVSAGLFDSVILQLLIMDIQLMKLIVMLHLRKIMIT